MENEIQEFRKKQTSSLGDWYFSIQEKKNICSGDNLLFKNYVDQYLLTKTY